MSSGERSGGAGVGEENQEEGVPFPGHIAQEPASQYGHPYGNISITGNAQAHFGDTFIHVNTPPPEADQYNTLLASLTFNGMDDRLHNVAKALPKTCRWLISHERFAAWTDVNHGFLWIKGIPGSGKSTIMKETLAWAEERWSSQIILSYFFNARSPHQLEKSSLGLYRSLVYQLLCALPGSRPLFEKRFASKVMGGQVEDWNEVELRGFLIDLITTLQLPALNIFIDALDEGAERDVQRMVWFLELLTQRAIAAARPLRICLSSRHYPHIRMGKDLFIIMEDQVEHSQDIEVYIRSELAGGQSLQMDYLRRQIRDRAAGVFLWVVLVVRKLNEAYAEGKSSMAMLRKLEEIPTDFLGLFTQLFSRYPVDDECITLLRWILFSIRPLSVVELYYAIQHTHLDTHVDDDVASTPATIAGYILNCSRGLVQSTKANPPAVKFIHGTVRDYLLNRNLAEQQRSGVYLSSHFGSNFQADGCHMKIAEECLHYLLNVCKKAPLTDKVLDQYPLAPYAAEFWWQHVQSSHRSCSQKLLDFASRLLIGDHTNLLTWVQLYDVDSGDHGPRLSLVADYLSPPLYYAASIGIPELISNLLLLGADVNAKGGRYGNALQAASYNGHEMVVQMLLEKGADVNAQGGFYGNALQAASERGHEKVVHMLLETGAGVNVRRGEYGNALYAASACGHEKVVQMLMGMGTGVNDPGGAYGNALQAASTGGHEKVVQMLLEKGAGVNVRGEYGNALRAASYNGHKNVVQMLLEKGADVNAQGGRYGNALQAASYNGYEKVVQILLEKGADVNAQGGFYSNTLQAASIGGHEKVVQMLLRDGADVNTQGKLYGNALQAASIGGHEKVVQMLLEKGADVNAQGGRYGNALYAAFVGGYEKVMQMLLDMGAGVNVQGGQYSNVLQAASACGHEKAVQMLLKNGADVNVQGGRYGNALYAASAGGHEKVVQMLLDEGADVNAQGGGYGNALQAASERGHEMVVQMLLEKGADVNAQGGFYGNTLQAASAGGHKKVVKMLLNEGADVNTQGGLYDNALYAASASGHEKVVQMLLAMGADVNGPGGAYGNALQAASTGGHEKVVQMLLGKGADVNAQGGRYGNALQAASYNGHEKVVQMLLEKGADVDAQKGFYGNTLPAASAGGHEKVLQILLNTRPVKETVRFDHIFRPGTDSGYNSISINKTQHESNLGNAHDSAAIDALADDATTYSNDSIETTQREELIVEFAQLLSDDLAIKQPNTALFDDLSLGLEDILADFSLRLAQEDTLMNFRTTVKFIYKHKGALTTSFKNYIKSCAAQGGQVEQASRANRAEKQDGNCHEGNSDNQGNTVDSEDGDGKQHRFPGEAPSAFEKVNMWCERTSDLAEIQDSGKRSAPYNSSSDQTPTNYSLLERLQKALCNASSYEWLLATLRNKLLLTTTAGTTLQSITDTILEVLPKPVYIGRQTVIPATHAVFEVDWPLRTFIQDQWPSWTNLDQIGRAMTLTGSLSEAQALVCSAYMNQVWPTSGGCLLLLIEDVLRTGSKATRRRADQTQLTAFDDGLCFKVQVEGTRGAVAEVGQQLCWLAAALRLAPLTKGFLHCIAQVKSVESPEASYTASSSTNAGSVILSSVRQPAEPPKRHPKLFKISVNFVPIDFDDEGQGTCWRGLFKSAIIVGGFPILRRLLPQLGLEVPLDVAAGLLGTRFINQFDNSLFVKSFSAMLAPSYEVDDLLIWHLQSNNSGGYISYLDCHLQPVNVTKAAVAQKRHIIGWCPTAKNCVGTASCDYDIISTDTENASSKCALYDCFLSSPEKILDGEAYQVGKDQQSVHFTSEELPKIIRRLGSRFVCLWDVQDQRGWLVDGVAALLHLLRASLKSDEQQTRYLYQLRSDQLEEPFEKYNFDASEAFLCSPHNQKAVILSFTHKGSTRIETLEDRMVHFYHVMDKAFNYQEKHRDVLRRKPRGLLEGWEFYDLVWRRDDPHNAHFTTIAPVGKGWVDLLRSIGAITLFGTGFGELIEPSSDLEALCPAWKTLPKNQFYIAASVSTLKRVMQNCKGNHRIHPKLLTESILWLTPAAPFDCCGCKRGAPSSELVQVVWPRSDVAKLAKTFEALDLSSYGNGAVIFGHNKAHEWHWVDTGPPLKGHPPVPSKERASDPVASINDSDLGDETSPEGDLPISSQEASLTTQRTSLSSAGQSQQSYGRVKACDKSQQVNGNVYYNITFNAAGDKYNASYDHTWPEPQQEAQLRALSAQSGSQLLTSTTQVQGSAVAKRPMSETLISPLIEQGEREVADDLQPESSKRRRLRPASFGGNSQRSQQRQTGGNDKNLV